MLLPVKAPYPRQPHAQGQPVCRQQALGYKVAPTAEALQKVAQQGLAQIQQKGYAAKALAHAHVQGVRQVCIAFHGKQVAVLHAQQGR